MTSIENEFIPILNNMPALHSLALALGALAVGAPETAPAGPQLGEAPRLAVVDRRLALMGTSLTLSVEAAERSTALAASEAAVRALEACEDRLSTWREDSELARLNRAPVGEAFALTPELAGELAAARELWSATERDVRSRGRRPGRAWGLRTGGRVPAADELARVRVAAGLGALELDGERAVRRDAALVLEEGGFGKGAGLDAALRALTKTGAVRATLDLGGQLAVLGEPGPEGFVVAVAHPDERDRNVLRVTIDAGSIATSGNTERAIEVDGERHGHLLDPRTGRPCAGLREPDRLGGRRDHGGRALDRALRDGTRARAGLGRAARGGRGARDRARKRGSWRTRRATSGADEDARGRLASRDALKRRKT